MRLYTVRLSNDIVVWANGEDHAGAVARQSGPDEREHVRVDSVAALAVVTPDSLPLGWDSGSIPYGRNDDVTIGEILNLPQGEYVKSSKDYPGLALQAFDIADESAISLIECETHSRAIDDVCWYDLSTIEEPFRPAIEQSIRYAEARGILQRLPEHPELVRFTERPE